MLKILENVEKCTGKSTEDAPKFIKSGDATIVQLLPYRPICDACYAWSLS